MNDIGRVRFVGQSRPVGHNQVLAIPRTYGYDGLVKENWSLWLDGNEHVLARGIHFDRGYEAMKQRCYWMARQYGLRAEVSSLKDQAFIVRAYLPDRAA